MNTRSDKEKIKVKKAAPKPNASGSVTATINGQVTITAENMYILGKPEGFVAYIKEGQGAIIMQFPFVVEPGTYDIEQHNIRVELDFNGLEDVAKTGVLILETFWMQKEYKGSFNVITIDDQKIEGVFYVRVI